MESNDMHDMPDTAPEPVAHHHSLGRHTTMHDTFRTRIEAVRVGLPPANHDHHGA